MELIILNSFSPEDRIMVCTFVISVLALIYSLTMDRIPASKFMKVHYMSLKRTIIFNTLILTVLSVVVLLAVRIWMLEISSVVVTIYIFIVVICILSLFIVSVEKFAHTNIAAAWLICLISNVWSIVPTPAAIRVCISMILLTSVIPYAILVLLRIYNGTLYSNNAKDANAKNEEQSSASSNSAAANISYGVFMFYVIMMLVMVTSLHFAGGIFPNVWWFVTGSTDKNVGGKFTIFLCISLLLSGLMTMSPPPQESSSHREGSDTASILEGVLQSSCVNNVIIGLITGIAFCTVA